MRKTRITLALLFLAGITLLFCGIGTQWWGWMAKLQFLPSCLALNFGAMAAIVILTFIFGRLYCSVICPLGVYQDLIVYLRRQWGKAIDRRRADRLREMKEKGIKPSGVRSSAAKVFGYRKEHRIVRYAILVLAIVCAFTSLQFLLALIAPYSAYGRIVHTVAGLAGIGKISTGLVITAAVTFIVISMIAWNRGRAYCTTICPVGTALSLISRFSLFRPVIDESKCIACGRCYRRCKASCIDGQAHRIDYSRCLVCFDCLDNCTEGALKYRFVGLHGPNAGPISGSGKPSGDSKPAGDADVAGSGKPAGKQSPADSSRRMFIATTAMAGTALALHAQNKRLDGGLAPVIDKQVPQRSERLVPFGALSVRSFYDKCTACQLCVSNCPNGVLRPSTDLAHFLQPQMGYEDGYCRPECTRCSEICPAGAIHPISREEKATISIGTAKIDLSLCLASNGEASCGNCARHCPSGAIRMVARDQDRRRIPVVSEGQCIGCGACEFLCPSRPISAITVNGLSIHRTKTA